MSEFIDLIKLRNKLEESIASLSLGDAIDHSVAVLTATNTEYPSAYSGDIDKISRRYSAITTLNNNTILEYQTIIRKISSEIEQLARKLFTTYDYTNKFSIENLRNQKYIFSESNALGNINEATAKIKSLSNWHYPGLLISPQTSHYIDCMVANDPLYLTSNDLTMLQDLISIFPEEYQRRLCVYTDDANVYNHAKLPKDQIGLIVAWDMFNYLHLVDIEKHIKTAIELLRPGGTLLISFNNCALVESAQMAEVGTFSYVTPQDLTKIADMLKLELTISNYRTGDTIYPYASIAEFKKAGKLITIKAHQVLGKIKAK